MDNFLNSLKLFLDNYKTESIVFILAIILLFVLYLLRSKTIVKQLVSDIIKESEEYFNSSAGQDKISYVETKLIEKTSSLPFYLKVFISKFITKNYIVTVIEKALNEIQDAFNPDAEDVDIIGNEIDKKKE